MAPLAATLLAQPRGEWCAAYIARNMTVVAVPHALPGSTILADIFERVFRDDKGIAFCDPWVRAGLAVSTEEAQLAVASVSIYLCYSEAIGASTAAAYPTFETLESPPSALPNDDDDGGGSSGAPALVYVDTEPRRFPPARPRRTVH